MLGQENFFNGEKGTIVRYKNNKDIDVIFEDGTLIKNVRYDTFRNGMLKNRNKPIKFNKGYIGYGIYNNYQHRKCYNAWAGMMDRCYGNRQPTYSGCYVDDEWFNFQNFAKWFYENYRDGYDLDKDILFKGNKVYSKKTCCFVPRQINMILVYPYNLKGKSSRGVTFNGQKYIAKITINNVQEIIGYYSSDEEAHKAYLKAKYERIHEIANIYRFRITKPCYDALMKYEI